MSILGIFLVLPVLNGFSMKEYCHKKDFSCEQPFFNQQEKLEFGRCSSINVLRRISRLGMIDCVRECLVTSQCKGINYRPDWQMCDVVGEIIPEDIGHEDGCMYSNISTWPETLAGECRNNDCADGEKCLFEEYKVRCEQVYCENNPNADNAISDEKFGIHKNLGTGLKFRCKDGYKLQGHPYSFCMHSGRWETQFRCILIGTEISNEFPKDCSDLPMNSKSGVYVVSTNITVFCDMDSDSGGWTVIQHRFNGMQTFEKNWHEYKTGFGDVSGEFWLGNDNLHAILSQRKYKMRVDLEYLDGNTALAVYSGFNVGNESTGYKLSISGYSGTAGDGMTDIYRNSLNGMNFSTADRNQDMSDTQDCAELKRSGWWHRNCATGNVNGLYRPGEKGDDVMHWRTLNGTYSLSMTRMMIKPA
ncbi:Angiopoietin-4,Angiopoietin-1,Ficolin-2,Tenascin-R,Tenascin,Fibrinogen C domain-containing protein 1-B,Fibrinogen C domain-containing protein 1 [Mytilus coruscus]|uniref:Angiopoietin-4,Angiopoietin-1,Ficolin-2,Tenascin-R,Tenascin,Fibrinogen C domain-containing protein 1-B,Fibrinogen C domain-containing protein 1 n=1 Tax=Mytilus coruscus TaxID=42192 RepID=A0A6J8CP13_MYTCO|nr:Angiopoietin-4,Angiopoietin-1,Ficolin-2,Tenascin-R,Tenascin,Fibrinogen C domain-containing protein 1-B,Fibrinogen C domain-containing protein 1 [Mytilus coruscus]